MTEKICEFIAILPGGYQFKATIPAQTANAALIDVACRNLATMVKDHINQRLKDDETSF